MSIISISCKTLLKRFCSSQGKSLQSISHPLAYFAFTSNNIKNNNTSNANEKYKSAYEYLKEEMDKSKNSQTTIAYEPTIPMEELAAMKRLRSSIQQDIDLGRFQQALENALQYVEKVKKHYGVSHPATYSAINNLALVFKITGDLESAQALYEKVLEGYASMFGRDHPSTLVVIQNLANLYKQQKMYDKSLQLFEEVLAYKDQKPETDQGEIALCMSQLAACLRELKRYDDSIKVLEKALGILIERYGEVNVITATCQNSLALTLKKAGKLSRAEEMYLRSLKTREELLPADHPHIVATNHNLGELYLELGQKEKAEEYFILAMESIKRMEEAQGQQ